MVFPCRYIGMIHKILCMNVRQKSMSGVKCLLYLIKFCNLGRGTRFRSMVVKMLLMLEDSILVETLGVIRSCVFFWYVFYFTHLIFPKPILIGICRITNEMIHALLKLLEVRCKRSAFVLKCKQGLKMHGMESIYWFDGEEWCVFLCCPLLLGGLGFLV